MRAPELAICLLVASLSLLSSDGDAQPAPAETPPSRSEPPLPDSAPGGDAPEALDAFVQGTELARQARWAQALSAFERAGKLKPHAITTYNIGACERAIGRYTRARGVFLQALAQHEASGGIELPDSLVSQTRTFLGEIDGFLAHAVVTVIPDSAAIAVDGRPLDVLPSSVPAGMPRAIVGTKDAGVGQRVPARTFEMLLDPGVHVLTLTRRGFKAALVNKSFAAGAHVALKLELDKLPATLRVRCNEPGAIVYLDGKDVGPAPIALERLAGSYRVSVEKDGFVTYEAQVEVGPGEESNLRANLVQQRVPLYERWWFWTTAAAVVATGVVVTWAVTRPEPEPPPYDGGSSNWVVEPQVRFDFP